MNTWRVSVDFNGLAIFDPDRLAAFCGGSIEKGANLWGRFTTSDDGDAVVRDGIVVPVIGINDGAYDVVVRMASEPSPIKDPVLVSNGVFPLQIERRAVLADMAVLWDWEDGVGWRELAVAPGRYAVTVRGFRSIKNGEVVRCGYEFVLAPVATLPEVSGALDKNMQVLTVDPVPLVESESALVPDDFAPLEARYGTALPPAFKAFYLAYNGGYPEANRVLLDEGVLSFNGFCPVKHGRLPIERLAADYADSWPETEGYLPFAYDDGGNGYLMSMRSADHGRIYLWGHHGRVLVPVCASFELFLTRLHVDE